jgi:glycosyltransferase involved in cell wall biosynthesis
MKLRRMPAEEPPLVSIVTPSFNQAQFLEKTILSVLSQDYPRVEYIVVDGGSTDGSVDVIKRFGDQLAYWISEPDRGQSDALNKGFTRSSGAIMGWLNSDDLYAPGAVSSAVHALAHHPSAGLAYGQCNVIDESGRFIRHLPAGPFDLANTLRAVPSIPQPAAFWRRSAWEIGGPLRTDYHFCMDLELWVSIAERFDVIFVPQLWAYFREYPGTKTSAGRAQFEREERQIRREHHRRMRLLRLALARPHAYFSPRVLMFLAGRMPPRRWMAVLNRARGYRQDD